MFQPTFSNTSQKHLQTTDVIFWDKALFFAALRKWSFFDK